jgi:tight adherence protein C
LFAISAILLFVAILSFSQGGAKRVALPQDEEKAKKRELRSIISGMIPFSPGLIQRLKWDTKIKRRLEAAHVKLSPQAYFNIKLLLMLALSVSLFLVSGKFDPIALSVPLIFGYIMPDIWLNLTIVQRRQGIIFLLPETIDLIGLCVEAGLDFTAALKWIVEKTPHNVLTEELNVLLDEIKWGKTRNQSLKDMAKRLNILELNSFVQTLVQADRMGTPVAEAFKVISEDTRALRFQRGERMALKAPIKILIPLIFCILPVIGIVVGGPLILQFMQGNMFKGF